MAKIENLTLQQGDTQPLVVYCEVEPIVYKAITAIEATAPVRITAPGHGLVTGWRCAVTNVKGMTEINGEANSLKAGDYHRATILDANTIEFNDVNGAGFKPYTSGGFVQYNTPRDLTGCAGRLQIRNKKGGGTVLFSMTTENGMIAIDPATSSVTLYFDAISFETVTWRKGYYDLELYKTVTRGAATVESVYTPIEGAVTLDADTTRVLP